MTSRVSQALWTSIFAVTVLGACTSASGPTYNVYSENLGDGTKIYRVECGGLLDSAATCRAVAQRTCGDQPVSAVQERDRWRGTGSQESDPRLLVFRCGTPVAKAEPQPDRRVTISEARTNRSSPEPADEGELDTLPVHLSARHSDDRGPTQNRVLGPGHTIRAAFVISYGI